MKYHIAWKTQLIEQLKLGRPLALSARIIQIRQDRIHLERTRDPEFDQDIKEAEATPPTNVRF